jgi:hypothetical protein
MRIKAQGAVVSRDAQSIEELQSRAKSQQSDSLDADGTEHDETIGGNDGIASRVTDEKGESKADVLLQTSRLTTLIIDKSAKELAANGQADSEINDLGSQSQLPNITKPQAQLSLAQTGIQQSHFADLVVFQTHIRLPAIAPSREWSSISTTPGFLSLDVVRHESERREGGWGDTCGGIGRERDGVLISSKKVKTTANVEES